MEAVIDKEYRLPWKLKPWQVKVHGWLKVMRFIVICAGRRSGKTIFVVCQLVIHACKKENSICWYVAPTYSQAKDIAWDLLKLCIQPYRVEGCITKCNDSEMLIRFVWGSIIKLKGADKPDTLRGLGLDFLAIDEDAMMKKEVWEVLRPALSDKKGKCVIISTPKGYNHFYKLCQMELKEPNVWKTLMLKTAEAGTISKDEIIQAKRDLDPRIYKQEYEASFETFGGQFFTDFSRERHVKSLDDIKFNPGQEYILGMDFGWAAPNATLFLNVDDVDHFTFFDEMKSVQTDIATISESILDRKYIREKKNQYGATIKKTYPDVVYCDPAGIAKNEAMGTSSVEELKKAGFAVRYHKNYPGIVLDRSNRIRQWLRNDKVTISSKCINLIQALEMCRHPDPKGDIQQEIPLKDGISDHWIDAFGFPLINKYPVKKAEWSIL